MSQLETGKADQQDLNTLKARVDNLTANPSTSTEGNAELIDIRVGFDGKTYPTAGTAIRSQSEQLLLESQSRSSLIRYQTYMEQAGKVFRFPNKVDYKVGDKLRFYNNGARINLLFYDQSNTQYIIKNGFDTGTYFEVTLTYDIIQIGMYNYDANAEVDFYLIDPYITKIEQKYDSSFEELQDNVNSTLSSYDLATLNKSTRLDSLIEGESLLITGVDKYGNADVVLSKDQLSISIADGSQTWNGLALVTKFPSEINSPLILEFDINISQGVISSFEVYSEVDNTLTRIGGMIVSQNHAKVLVPADTLTNLANKLVRLLVTTNVQPANYVISNIKLLLGETNPLDARFDEKYSVFRDYNMLTELEEVIGQIRTNTNSDYAFARGKYCIYDVSLCSKVKVTGYDWQLSQLPLAVGVDASGLVLQVISPGTVGTDSHWTDYEVELTTGVTKLYVNGTTDTANNLVACTGYQTVDLQEFVDQTKSQINDINNDIKEIKDVIAVTNYKILTLGDSITMLGTGNRGWIKYFMERIPSTLVANVAMNSAVLTDYSDTEYDGDPQQNLQKNNVLGNQIQKIINNAYEAPDIIIIAIGTNGGITTPTDYAEIDAAYYDSNNDLIPVENADRTTTIGAFRYANEKLHELYPNALIFWCVPIVGFEKTRSALNVMKYEEALRMLTTYANMPLITTNHCFINGINEVQGANGEYLIDGLHPNEKGARMIGYYNASQVKPYLDMVMK